MKLPPERKPDPRCLMTDDEVRQTQRQMRDTIETVMSIRNLEIVCNHIKDGAPDDVEYEIFEIMRDDEMSYTKEDFKLAVNKWFDAKIEEDCVIEKS